MSRVEVILIVRGREGGGGSGGRGAVICDLTSRQSEVPTVVNGEVPTSNHQPAVHDAGSTFKSS